MIVTDSLQPVHLLPRFVERIWGSPSLGPYFAPPSEQNARIGEVWLTATDCRVEGTSQTLADLAAAHPTEFGCDAAGSFPLLLKLLFPTEKLSVQVHPNDAQAQASLGEPRGKTECWYVLSAEPGAEVAVGFRDPLSPEAARHAIADGSIDADGSIEQHLRKLPVHAGDMIFVDAGTVHAIGPGMVLLETQQYSDVTYRLWDYGRPRELHVEQGLAVTRSQTQAGPVAPTPMDGFDRLIACPYFTVDRFRLQAGRTAELACTGQMQIIIALGDGATLRSHADQERALPRAHAVLVPASETTYALHADGSCEVVRVLAGQRRALP